MAKRNIVFFHAESWDGRMLGAMGHPALKGATPNVDRIAGSGVLFENAYCSHPICCPSRANMWSGRYTHNCESWNNYKGLEPGMWSLLGQLPETHTLGVFGKLDYMSGGHTQLARLGAWLGTSGVEKPIHDKDTSQNFTVAEDDNVRCHEHDWKRVDDAIDFMEQHRSDDEPFFLYVSTGLVHAAFHTNRHWLSKIPEDAVDIPPMDGTQHPARLYQRMAKAWRAGYDDETVRRVRRIYCAMCAEADALMGRLYDAIHEMGLAEETYFVFGSDHGELALEHQEWYKMSMYEGSVRVPLAMAGPGIAQGLRLPNLVSLIDMCPTLMEMAGLPARSGMDGESLMPLLTGATTESRGSAYACFTGTTLNTSAFMLRKGRWKYVVFVGFRPELFDIAADPGELNDLAASRPDVVKKLDAELRSIVDYEQTHRDRVVYCKEEFRQWRRQAKRGLHVDGSYSLRDSPSTDYWRIMGNCFTGYDETDEETVKRWLES